MFLPKTKMRCKVTRYDARHSQCFFYFRFRFRRSFKETLRLCFIWIPICKTTILIAKKTPKQTERMKMKCSWLSRSFRVTSLDVWDFPPRPLQYGLRKWGNNVHGGETITREHTRLNYLFINVQHVSFGRWWLLLSSVVTLWLNMHSMASAANCVVLVCKHIVSLWIKKKIWNSD